VAESSSASPVERVLLVDPSDAFRAGLRQAFLAGRARPALAEAGSAAEAAALAARLRPDAAVVEAELPDGSGVALCRALVAAAPGVAVVVLSQADWDVYLAGAWAAGAAGFLLKRVPAAEVVRAVRRAAAGPLFSAEQLGRIRAWRRAVDGRLEALGAREREVLRLVAAGASNREIAQALTLSESTVEKHVGALLRKLAVPSRTGLLAFILRHHLDAWSGLPGGRWDGPGGPRPVAAVDEGSDPGPATERRRKATCRLGGPSRGARRGPVESRLLAG